MMKIRPLLLIAGFAMLFALMAFPSALSADQASGNDHGSGQNSPLALQPVDLNPAPYHPLAPHIPALTVSAHIAIRLASADYLLTAEGGGGGTTDPIHTDRTGANGIGAWEIFNLEPQGGNVYAFKTASGNYLTAQDGGGNTSDALHANATAVGAWERFALEPQAGGSFAIKTPNGVNYVTAQDGGGKSGDAIHTNATAVGSWEKFWLILASPL